MIDIGSNDHHGTLQNGNNSTGNIDPHLAPNPSKLMSPSIGTEYSSLLILN